MAGGGARPHDLRADRPSTELPQPLGQRLQVALVETSRDPSQDSMPARARRCELHEARPHSDACDHGRPRCAAWERYGSRCACGRGRSGVCGLVARRPGERASRNASPTPPPASPPPSPSPPQASPSQAPPPQACSPSAPRCQDSPRPQQRPQRTGQRGLRLLAACQQQRDARLLELRERGHHAHAGEPD